MRMRTEKKIFRPEEKIILELHLEDLVGPFLTPYFTFTKSQ